jgi:4-alpha-glucanotransferase
MSADLDRLAEAHGIALVYKDEMGSERAPSEKAKRRLLGALGVAAETDDDVQRSLAALALPHCHIPGWLEESRAWGITCQLYSLRSQRNWGIGDFEDLATLAEIAAPFGADFIGINPLHALFFADPAFFSPYTPSSRRFLNPLYIAIDDETALADGDRQALQEARQAELIDYLAVSALKHKALEGQFRAYRSRPITSDFEAFRREQGDRLERFALFEAISEVMVGRSLHCGWRDWPDDFKDLNSSAVRRFGDENSERVLFHIWLQWRARQQLAGAQRRALAAGMRIGLYLDLAVGVSAYGADTWCEPDTILRGVRIGSPPDAFNARGQDWGLSPLSPLALRAERGRMFGEVLADAIGPAGAIRIDHAMALQRLYLIPDGLQGTDGSYVVYPFDDMLRAVAETSQRSGAIIVGEDLGTVPPNFRETMQANRAQGYRVLFFERDRAGNFHLPQTYERDALACISTHDLPTLRGWWSGSDLDDRERIGVLDPESAGVDRARRAEDRRLLIQALAASGMLPDHLSGIARGDDAIPAELSQDLAIALSRFLAVTPCRLVAVQLEDLTGTLHRANLPGTVHEHPNWRRKLPVALESLSQFPDFTATLRAVDAERPRS